MRCYRFAISARHADGGTALSRFKDHACCPTPTDRAMPNDVHACYASEDGKEGLNETLAMQIVWLYT
jgi:hypothetical protein